MVKTLTFGYSPCPNDTFMFNAIADGAAGVAGYTMKPVLHDVETLNGLAMDAVLDITKLSFYAWMAVKDRYRLLHSGAAMGFGCGPVLIARNPINKTDIRRYRVALPGHITFFFLASSNKLKILRCVKSSQKNCFKALVLLAT